MSSSSLLPLLALCLVGALAGGCTVQAAMDTGARLDVPATDTARPDTPPVSCTTAAECNDGLDCTFDDCVVGNLCSHTALDDLCNDGERCDLTRGCTSGCTGAPDCNVGRNYCDGTYGCNAGTCFVAVPRNCDDGNECTVDACDPAAMDGLGGCVYSLATGCDGGVGGGDAGGPVCEPFDPATGYTGTFRIAPVLSLDCLVDYRVTDMTFTITGSMLQVTGAPMLAATLTGPVPTGDTFSVSGSAGCASYTLTGTFACANRFSGTFTSSFSGTCAGCGGGAVSVVGRL